PGWVSSRNRSCWKEWTNRLQSSPSKNTCGLLDQVAGNGYGDLSFGEAHTLGGGQVHGLDGTFASRGVYCRAVIAVAVAGDLFHGHEFLFPSSAAVIYLKSRNE